MLLCVVALLIGAGIVVGATNLGSITTSTAEDFEGAQLDNLTIVDDTVQLGATQGSTADTPGANDFQSTGMEAGVIINPNEDLGGLEVELYSADPDEVRVVRHSDGVELASNTSVSGSSAKIEVNLDEGVEYRVLVDHPSDPQWYNNAAYPYTSDDVDVTTGYDSSGNEDPDNVWLVDGVTAFVGQVHDDAEYINSVTVEDPVNASIKIDQLDNVEIQAEWQRDVSGSWETVATETITTTGTHEADLDGNPADEWRIVWNATVTGGGWFDSLAVMDSESFEFENTQPALSNASPTDGEEITEEPVMLEVDVEDADFAKAHGDEVTVTFRDDTDDVIGTDTLTSNGTAEIEDTDPVGGDNEWYAVAEDQYGGEDRSPNTGTHTFEAPGDLEIRDETTEELIDEVNVTVEFYFERNDEPDLIETRNTTDGTIDMSGLPANEPFIAVANSTGYFNRRIFVDSLFETQRIYLLDETADAVQPTFELIDFTGQYPIESTLIELQRSIDSEWQTVEGDFFGGANAMSAQLLFNERHRMIITNIDTGQSKNLGTFTPASTADIALNVFTASEFVEVVNSPSLRLDPNLNSFPGSNVNISMILDSRDDEFSTYTVTVSNGSATLFTGSGDNPDGQTFSHVFNLTDQVGETITVTAEYTTDSGSGTLTEQFTVTESFDNEYSLFAVVQRIGGDLGDGAQMFITLFATILTLSFVSIRMTPLAGAAFGWIVLAMFVLLGFAPVGWLVATAIGVIVLSAVRTKL